DHRELLAGVELVLEQERGGRSLFAAEHGRHEPVAQRPGKAEVGDRQASDPGTVHLRYNCDVASKPVEQLESVVIRFAGDSGDGMQLTGGRFTSETALVGNDLATFPDFPAEIRAPAGS